MNRQMTCGTSSISFQNPVFVQSCASVVSRKEGEGPLGAYFDTICEDPMFGTDTWEAAESTLQKQAALLAIKKNGLTCSDIQLLFAGDLLAQTSASSFGTADLKIPFYGLFGACSTMGESLSLGSMCIDGGYGKYILCATSSHFASAEKEFRFPLGYGNQRPLSATWTVTGAGAFFYISGVVEPLLNQHDRVGADLLGFCDEFHYKSDIAVGAVLHFGAVPG